MNGRSLGTRLALVFLLAAAGLGAAATAGAGAPGWGNPGGCYYGTSTKCWVYSHPSDQGRTSCAVVDVAFDPGHVGPFGYTRAAATDIANIRSEERRVGKECRSRWSPYH